MLVSVLAPKPQISALCPSLLPCARSCCHQKLKYAIETTDCRLWLRPPHWCLHVQHTLEAPCQGRPSAKPVCRWSDCFPCLPQVCLQRHKTSCVAKGPVPYELLVIHRTSCSCAQHARRTRARTGCIPSHRSTFKQGLRTGWRAVLHQNAVFAGGYQKRVCLLAECYTISANQTASSRITQRGREKVTEQGSVQQRATVKACCTSSASCASP